MFGFEKQIQPDLSIACCLGVMHYSLAVLTQNKHVLHCLSKKFDESTLPLMAKTLASDVERLNLLAHDCQLILFPGQYQLILMDALDIPEADMAKALRWSLKGLSDYDLDDVAIDAFMLPEVAGDSQKKIMVAITPLSKLDKMRAVLESACLEVTTASVSEIALINLLALMFPVTSDENTAPLLMISLCDTIRKLHIVHNNTFYLVRELPLLTNAITDEPVEMSNIILELERSIDYCINKLNLSEPKQILFTPGFHNAVAYLKIIEEKLGINTTIIDLNDYLNIEPALSLKEQHDVFYSIAGAIQGAST
ncbi:hypothetical protein N9Q05_00340 [bacterium]|nr:hypothetical protein [bacterium]